MCQPPTPFKKTFPCAILLLPFFDFSDSPFPQGELIKIYSPPPLLNRAAGGRGDPNYAKQPKKSKF